MTLTLAAALRLPLFGEGAAPPSPPRAGWSHRAFPAQHPGSLGFRGRMLAAL